MVNLFWSYAVVEKLGNMLNLLLAISFQL